MSACWNCCTWQDNPDHQSCHFCKFSAWGLLVCFLWVADTIWRRLAEQCCSISGHHGNERGETDRLVSYRWTAWVWEITGWSSRLQENPPITVKNIPVINKEKLKDAKGEMQSLPRWLTRNQTRNFTNKVRIFTCNSAAVKADVVPNWHSHSSRCKGRVSL